AGEVVERPASAVKELVENALDAGARQVQVEVRSGGLGLIRAVDDGCGIPPAEAELAFARHATSKLRAAQGLVAIQTLGLLGAPRSLGSGGGPRARTPPTPRLVPHPRHADDELGVTLTIEAGQVVERKPWAGAVGTTLLVKNLFYNVPARLKFLRTATGEAG